MPRAELRLRAFAAPGWRGLRIRGDDKGNATVAGQVTGGRTIRLRSQLPLIAEDSARTWIHLTLEGSWEGHPMGPFEFDESVFAQLIENFEGQSNAVPLTYEHPEYGDGQPKPAAGWIHELQAREDGLWAFVEFTDRAAEMIRAGEYRYCSVVVVFDSVSRDDAEEIGAELLEVGLTNSPFIDGQQPIQLSRRARRKANRKEVAMSDVELMQEAIQALGEDASIERLMQWVKNKKSLLEVEQGGGGESEEPEGEPAAAAHEPAEEPTTAANEAGAEGGDTAAQPSAEGEGERDLVEDPEARQAAAGEALSILEESLGMEAAAVLDFLRSNAERLAEMAGQTPEGGGSETDAQGAMSSKLRIAESQVKRLAKQVEQLQAKDEEREAAKRKADAERWFEEQLEAGRVAEGERQHLIELRQRDAKWCDEYIGKRGAQVPMGRITGPEGGGDDATPPRKLSRREADAEAQKLGSKGYAAFLQAIGFNKSPNEALERARNRAAN